MSTLFAIFSAFLTFIFVVPYLNIPALALLFRSFVGFVVRKKCIASVKPLLEFVVLSLEADNNEAKKPFFLLAIAFVPGLLLICWRMAIDTFGPMYCITPTVGAVLSVVLFPQLFLVYCKIVFRFLYFVKILIDCNCSYLVFLFFACHCICPRFTLELLKVYDANSQMQIKNKIYFAFALRPFVVYGLGI